MKKTIWSRGVGVVAVCVGLVLVGAMLVGLTGCQRENEAKNESTAPKDHEPITILTAKQSYEDFAELLKEKHPEVNLEFVSFCGGATSSYMKKSLEHGDATDIYAVTYVPEGEDQKENLLNLANYGVVNEYASTMVDNLNVNGGIYLLPSRYELLGIVYNKTILEENGWDVPNSFQDMKKLAPKVQAAGYEMMNMNTSLTGVPFGTFFALGNTNYFNTPAGAKWKTDYLKGEAKAVGSLEPVTDYFQKWIDAGFMNTYYYDHMDESANDDFDGRKYVFQMYSNRVTGEDTTDEYGLIPFLSEDGENNMLVRLVSRYYGLNKKLGEKGNEQKLEDAMKVLELMSTQEGQAALMGNKSTSIPATMLSSLPEGSPYQDVLELIRRGSMIDMVYGGWEDHIIPLIEQYGNPWIRGSISGKEFLVGMDKLNEELLQGENEDKVAKAEENIDLNTVARMCAIAEGKAADADVAMISLPAFHGFADGVTLENKEGAHCGIYAGDIDKEDVSMFSMGTGTVLKIKATGSEIKSLAEAGFQVEGDPEPYEYCLVTKGDIELEADKEYILAISSAELSDSAMLKKAEDTELDINYVMMEYVAQMKTIRADDIMWN